MRRVYSLILSLCLVLSICACGQNATAPTWQEQYDLGIRYLSEGNYEEAILAFTAAIEIDPKRPDAYIGLAELYLAQNNIEQAEAILNQAIDSGCTDMSIYEMLNNLEQTALRLLQEAWWEKIRQDLPVPPIPLQAVAHSKTGDLDGAPIYWDYNANGDMIRSKSQFDSGSQYGLATDIREYYYRDGGATADYSVFSFYRESDGQLYQYIMHAYDQHPRHEYDSCGRVLQEQTFAGDHIETVSYTYSGTSVTVDFSYLHFTSEEPVTWRTTYTMQDPANEVSVGGYGMGTIPVVELRHISIRESDSRGDLYEIKYDAAGNVLEERDIRLELHGNHTP